MVLVELEELVVPEKKIDCLVETAAEELKQEAATVAFDELLPVASKQLLSGEICTF